MKFYKALLSGLVGTSLMTLFSYFVSGSKQENFKEPELLAALENNALPKSLKGFALPAGWSTHYTIGLVWATVYEYLYQKTDLKPTVKNGLILGGASGLIGIAIWKLCFKIHPDPPRIDFKKFYIQLLFAHLVYGLSVTKTISPPKF